MSHDDGVLANLEYLPNTSKLRAQLGLKPLVVETSQPSQSQGGEEEGEEAATAATPEAADCELLITHTELTAAL